MAIPTANYGIKNDKAHTLRIESMISDLKVTFPAFITSFSQNFDSNWSQEDVYGRIDPIATFQGTKRSISLNLSLPAADETIAAQNLSNCAELTQMLYPGYINVYGGQKNMTPSLTKQINAAKKSGGTAASRSRQIRELKMHKRGRVIARSPLVKVEFANLIKDSVNGGGLLGYFTSISWNPVIDMGYFVSGSDLFPKVIELSFAFNVLHQHDLGVGPSNKSLAKKFPF